MPTDASPSWRPQTSLSGTRYDYGKDAIQGSMMRTPAVFLRRLAPPALAATIALAAIACAPPPAPSGPEVPAPTTLAQTLPLGGRATYQVVDSVRIEADGERVRFTTEASYSALVRMRFRSAEDGLLVEAELTEFEGSLVNPTTGAVQASLDDVDGAWTAAVTRKGRVSPKEVPTVSDAFRTVVGASDFLRSLFISLPDAPVIVGAEWVDTLSATDEGPQTLQSTTAIARTRVAERGDAAGRPVLILESVIDTTIDAESHGDMDEPSTQRLRGTLRRRAVWDAGLRRLVRYRATGRLTGELRVDGMEPIPLSADMVREVVAR